MFHVKHSCVGASRSSFRVLHLVRRRRFAVPPPLRACSPWACRCSSGGRPWRWGERGTRGASVPVRSRGQRAMARGALDDGQPMRTSQSSSCGGGVAAWRCGGAAGQAPILSSGRPLSRPDRPRRSDWPDPIPSGYSFSLVSRSAGRSLPATCQWHAGGALPRRRRLPLVSCFAWAGRFPRGIGRMLGAPLRVGSTGAHGCFT